MTGLGAAFVAYDEADAASRLDRLSRDLNGFRAILDAARGEGLSTLLARLAPGGRLVVLDFSAAFRRAHEAAGAPPGLMARLGFAADFLRIKWMAGRSGASRRVTLYDVSAQRARHPDWFEHDLSTLFDLLGEGRIAPCVQRVFGLEDAIEAHRLIEAGQVEGRLVLDLTSEVRRSDGAGAR